MEALKKKETQSTIKHADPSKRSSRPPKKLRFKSYNPSIEIYSQHPSLEELYYGTFLDKSNSDSGTQDHKNSMNATKEISKDESKIKKKAFKGGVFEKDVKPEIEMDFKLSSRSELEILDVINETMKENNQETHISKISKNINEKNKELPLFQKNIDKLISRKIMTETFTKLPPISIKSKPKMKHLDIVEEESISNIKNLPRCYSTKPFSIEGSPAEKNLIKYFKDPRIIFESKIAKNERRNMNSTPELIPNIPFSKFEARAKSITHLNNSKLLTTDVIKLMTNPPKIMSDSKVIKSELLKPLNSVMSPIFLKKSDEKFVKIMNLSIKHDFQKLVDAYDHGGLKYPKNQYRN